jgi:UDP-N-acetylglucosamine diphosphorylase/glucosamine-1-phosphate N-acetyltransferase
MHLTFFDSEASWKRLLPLTYTRPSSDLRVGILKIHEKWKHHLNASSVSFVSQAYLENHFPKPEESSLAILGNVLPSNELIDKVLQLNNDEAIVFKDQIIAIHHSPDQIIRLNGHKVIELNELEQIHFTWDIFQQNGNQIRKDYQLITQNRSSQGINDSATVAYGDDIFVEEGVSVKAAVLNAENGPIYLGKGSEVQEGALIRGPFALGDHSFVNMGAKIRGDSTIGPYSKVGGELSNSVIQGYSNKGHEGFLGNSVIGEWCNIGADTNNSNLKNNYTNIKMWDYETNRFRDSGLQFCGLIMGDHSKCGINTMFNTGTTVGVSANIYGSGFPRNFIPSFSWGGASGFSTYQPKKVFETAELVMQRRGKVFSDYDKAMLSNIFERTANYRIWDK